MKGLGTGHRGDVAEERVCGRDTLQPSLLSLIKLFPGRWRGKKEKREVKELRVMISSQTRVLAFWRDVAEPFHRHHI